MPCRCNTKKNAFSESSHMTSIWSIKHLSSIMHISEVISKWEKWVKSIGAILKKNQESSHMTSIMTYKTPKLYNAHFRSYKQMNKIIDNHRCFTQKVYISSSHITSIKTYKTPMLYNVYFRSYKQMSIIHSWKRGEKG